MTPPLVELLNVDVTLNGSSILRDITWHLNKREHWAVLGANGSGKSTFLRVVAGQLWPSPGRGIRRYTLNGVTQFTAVGVRERIAFVSPELQEKYLRREWNLRVLQALRSGVQNTDYVQCRLNSEQKSRAQTIAKEFGIANLLGRNIQSLSTGELRRVLIARGMMAVPQILICDEICDGLDAAARRQFLKMLDSVARAGTQLIYTTHRSDELPAFITHRLRLVNGSIVECTNGHTKLSRPQPTKVGVPVRSHGTPDLSGSRGPIRRCVIKVENASVYVDRHQALRDINWCLRDGENWGIFGTNGSGKSTFLKLLYRELYPATKERSRVTHFDFPPRTPTSKIKGWLGYVSPALQTQYEYRVTGRAVVLSGFFSTVGARDAASRDQERKADQLLDEFGCSQLADKRIGQMSYGETRKLLLLRALVHRPKVLLCDEPFDGLDASIRKEFQQSLESLPERGTQLVLVTHHLEDLPATISHAMVFRQGMIAEQGPLKRVVQSLPFQELFT